MKTTQSQKRIASLEIVSKLEDLEDTKNLCKLTFSDCTFITKKERYKKGDLVLVVRFGAILPRSIAKKAGSLRYFKDYTVKRLVLRGHVSDCILFTPSEVLQPWLLSKYNLESNMGKELAYELGIRASKKYKAYFKAKDETIWKTLTNMFSFK